MVGCPEEMAGHAVRMLCSSRDLLMFLRCFLDVTRERVTLAAGNQITREFQLALEAQQAMLSEAEQAGSPETTVPGRRGAWERGRGVAASVTEDSALASVA